MQEEVIISTINCSMSDFQKTMDIMEILGGLQGFQNLKTCGCGQMLKSKLDRQNFHGKKFEEF